MKRDTCYAVAGRSFRARRIRRFFEALAIPAHASILDIGGTSFFWELARDLQLPPCRVTVLNVAPPPVRSPIIESWVCGDGRALPFGDGVFDAVFCNSVIEHVGGDGDQERMAREIRRVAHSYFVQTPDPLFPVETHVLTPFVHWLPRAVRRRMIPYLTLRHWICGTDPGEVEELRSVRLIGIRTLSRLFPDAGIVRERFMGLSKSLVAIRTHGRTA